MQRSPPPPRQPPAAALGQCNGVAHTLTKERESSSPTLPTARISQSLLSVYEVRVTDLSVVYQESGACHAAQTLSKRFGTHVWSILLPCLHAMSKFIFHSLYFLYKSRVKPHNLCQVGVIGLLQGSHQGCEGTPSFCLGEVRIMVTIVS